MEAYLLRCAAPLAAATGSSAVLAEAAGWLEQASIPDGGAWVFGYEAYLSLAQAWLGRTSRNAPARYWPAAGRRGPGAVDGALAAALVTDGRALIRLGRTEQARAELDRAARLAGEHGLPHVLRDAREGRRLLR